jgi:hypothetical protein
VTPASPAAKRYVRDAALSYAVYGALTAGLAEASGAVRALPGWVSYLAALVCAAPVLGAVCVTARYFRDETSGLDRDIQVEALVWAMGVTFCVATAWGFLGRLVGAPQPPSYCAFAVFGSVVASVQLARRLFPRRARCVSRT